ncbi:MAG: hypothetical protein IIU65_01805 [Clostridia bacterium]|nr:hypothetical protein [Clostridia bacterium]
MLNYEKLSDKILEEIKSDRENNTSPKFAFSEENVIRRDNSRDKANLLRTAFIRYIYNIMHCPY